LNVENGIVAPGEDAGPSSALNGVEHDQDMMNGEEPPEPVAAVGLAGERQPNKERVTTPYLTKYERARILGTRALQIRHVFCEHNSMPTADRISTV
jgi:DNA-directed RNA polymerases I, II, and III subunit RPABC2